MTVSAEVTCEYFDEYWGKLAEENCSLEDFPGITSASFIAPQGVAIAVIRSTVRSTDATADAQLTIYAAYSPSDSFLHLSRASDEPISVGDTILLDVFKTNDATVYYDVFARGHTVWSEATTASQISFQATPQMAPSLKVIAYIIDPNNEILADSLPLEVTWNHTAALAVTFDADQVLPGDPVQLSIQSDQETMVGLAIVDESVYALNEGRLNMQEV